jgi:hypothetical protein
MEQTQDVLRDVKGENTAIAPADVVQRFELFTFRPLNYRLH